MAEPHPMVRHGFSSQPQPSKQTPELRDLLERSDEFGVLFGEPLATGYSATTFLEAEA